MVYGRCLIFAGGIHSSTWNKVILEQVPQPNSHHSSDVATWCRDQICPNDCCLVSRNPEKSMLKVAVGRSNICWTWDCRDQRLGCPAVLRFGILPSGKHTKNYWKLPFIVDLPMKHGDFPQFFVCLPEGKYLTVGKSTNSDRGDCHGHSAQYNLACKATDIVNLITPKNLRNRLG